MEKLKFKVRIYKSVDKKILAEGNLKNYVYGNISIRDLKLTKHIGKTVYVGFKIR